MFKTICLINHTENYYGWKIMHCDYICFGAKCKKIALNQLSGCLVMKLRFGQHSSGLTVNVWTTKFINWDSNSINIEEQCSAWISTFSSNCGEHNVSCMHTTSWCISRIPTHPHHDTTFVTHTNTNSKGALLISPFYFD